MDAKILAICDAQKNYAVRLMEAFCSKKQLDFQMHVFSSVEDLEQFVRKKRIEILLISGSLMSKKIIPYEIEKIILLSDGSYYEEFSVYESIYKYQSASQIMKEVLSYYAEVAKPVTGLFSGKQEFEVYGVYSPIGRCGKTALAESLAEFYGKRKKTLLLNLQSFSAHTEQLAENAVWDLTDLIYFLRQGKKTFLYKLGSIVRAKDSYDYILPMKIPADLRSVTLAEWTELLEKLATDSDYQVVVVDLGQDICGLFQMLHQCSKVYMPILSDPDSKRKLENFLWILEEENFKKVILGIQKIYLPVEVEGKNMKLFMEEWVERSCSCDG